jgi:hypothetical protein
MRLKREEVAVREQFVTEAFKADPTLTVRAVQTKLAEKFGKQMRPGRVLELKKALEGPVVITATETKPAEPVTLTQEQVAEAFAPVLTVNKAEETNVTPV